jgi:hypothetical protein
MPETPSVRPKVDDSKLTTSLRIDAEKLGALKMIALRERVRVNDLVVEGIDHVIALRKPAANGMA